MTEKRKTGRPTRLRGKVGAHEGHMVIASEALALRIAGATYRQIGERLKVTHTTAFRAVQQELADLDAVKAKQAERLRDLEVERCERLILGLWSNASRGDDKSVHACLRVMERKARLLGIDAPTHDKLDVNLADLPPLTIRIEDARGD